METIVFGDLGLLQWVLAVSVVVVGAAIQGVIGYGVALFSAPLLFLIHPTLVPAPLVLIGGILPLMLLRANARHVVVRDLAWAWPGALLGAALAYLVIGLLPLSAWQTLFGALIVVAVVLSWVRLQVQPRGSVVFSGSLCAATMGTITGVGGPPLGLAYQNASPARVRGTLYAIFVPMSVMSLTALGMAGRFGWQDVALAASLLPGVVLGLGVSRYLGHWIPLAAYRNLMLGVALVAGGYTLVRGVVQWG
ncbi:sulfite exporter TauE/SafE family protein [Alkalilimnicola ehrlichii MLHE-1]|uniref:Probable membrane transporter protein n=1 Tax=Alkalilimnicola ehrlichii (strain ATCC BAA-1101 / DSM 17681 / MLHE-1) TaxID=187272 RepID=Q0A6A3_ALKEH|nr:sulfite exporter TauE/SafE family protein [Alkalilimnicola ehrlichii]ABI57634.1 conserved hypothetical protein [Alkalilimnicola ehrlichii MLHE-1]